MHDNLERRFTSGRVELRNGTNGRPVIRGYAAVFSARSENLGGFIEVITPGAFDNVLSDDVRALFNHDANLILGRTKAGTCRLHVDVVGLAYEIDPPDTQLARDLTESLRRGDIDQSSFAFTVARDGQKWTDGPTPIRTITKVERLYDVSPVTYPAYPDTSVAARELQRYRGTHPSRFCGSVHTTEQRRRRELELMCADAGAAVNPGQSDATLLRELHLRALEAASA